MKLYGTYTQLLIMPIKQNWRQAWYNKAFRKGSVFGIVGLLLMLVFTYYFLNYSEDRDGGIVMNDWVLDRIPARDVSMPITFCIATVMLLFTLRCLSNPNMLLTFLIAFIFILVTRIITISVTELRPPTGLIRLDDPICNLMYHSRFITRDLFYSGHTATLFLFYLCASKKPDRYYMFFATVAIGILVLVQHVHYTIDVVCAPFFAFGCYWLAKKILLRLGAFVR